MVLLQTLCLPFAWLLTMETNLTLDLLEKMTIPPSPEKPEQGARSGLEVLLQAWCDSAVDTVQGSYSIRVK